MTTRDPDVSKLQYTFAYALRDETRRLTPDHAEAHFGLGDLPPLTR